MKTDESSLLSPEYLQKIQNSFLVQDVGVTLNHSKIADSCGIQKSNTKFRKFLKGETASISSDQLLKMIRSIGYDFIIVPVRGKTDNHEDMIKMRDTNLDGLCEDLVNLCKKNERAVASKETSNKHIANYNVVNDAMFVDDELSGFDKELKDDDVIKTTGMVMPEGFERFSPSNLLDEDLEDELSMY